MNDYNTNVPQWMRDKSRELEELITNGEIEVSQLTVLKDTGWKRIIDGARP